MPIGPAFDMPDEPSMASFSVNSSFSSSTSSPESKPRKRVQFDASQPVIHEVQQGTKSSKLWYSADELEKIKRGNAQIMKMVLLEEEESLRGLEPVASTKSKRQSDKDARCQAVSDALSEQGRQFYEGISDPDMIADIYRRGSQRSQELAVERAVKDAKDIGITVSLPKNTSSKRPNSTKKLGSFLRKRLIRGTSFRNNKCASVC